MSGNSGSVRRFLSGTFSRQSSFTKDPMSTGPIKNSEIDISYITPRLIVMTIPRENTLDEQFHLAAQLTLKFLDEKHPNSYTLYPLEHSSDEQQSERRKLFHNRVHDVPLLIQNESPCLNMTLWFTQRATDYLLQSPSNTIVIHCINLRNHLAYAACSLLAYHGLFAQADHIIQFYERRRCATQLLSMSQKRYIQYICNLSHGTIERPHFQDITVTTISIAPVPLVNRQKTKCRPFVEIYDFEGMKICSTYQDPSTLQVYTAKDSTCVIPINLTINGDITIHVKHASKEQSRQSSDAGVHICQIAISSNFISVQESELSYPSNELDGIDHNNKSQKLFRITLNVNKVQLMNVRAQEEFSNLLDVTMKKPLALFRDENQKKQAMDEFTERQDEQNVLYRPKSKEDSISRTSSISTSTRSSRVSSTFSFSPQSPTSFVNPRANPLTPPNILPQTSNEEPKRKKSVDLFYLDDDLVQTNNPSDIERSMSSDGQKNDFTSSIDSQKSLMDDDIFLSSWNENVDLPKPISLSTVNPTREKNSTFDIKPSQTPPPSASPNYDVNIQMNGALNAPKKNPTPTVSQQVKREDKKTDLFGKLDPLGDSRSRADVQNTYTLGMCRIAIMAKDVDPLVMRVRDWTEGKKGNIRALLCSLSNVVWSECKWAGCQMSELITYDQVKKIYRKALLCIHPDKLTDDPNLPLAKLIFVELNEAWAQFQQQANTNS